MWVDDCNIRARPLKEGSRNRRTTRVIVIAVLVIVVGTAIAWVISGY